MAPRELAILFRDELFSVGSSEMLFNQYNNSDLKVDLPEAPRIRRQNLMNYVASLSSRPEILVVGEAAGPWGCRFSGVPFTGERQLCQRILPFSGRQSSREEPSIDTKMNPPYTSRSAESFWQAMKPYHSEFFVWDCVPLHPHLAGDVLSVRSPTQKEVSHFSQLLKEIREVVQPREVVAVGRIAERSLREIGISSTYVRHPSYGGATRFKREVEIFFRTKQ